MRDSMEKRQVADDGLRRKMKHKINFYFYSVSIGTVLSFSSLVALQGLQTSINIEGNKGAIAITTAYFGSVLYCVFAAPAMLQKFSTGVNLVLADLSFAVYCISNFYPELYILIFGSVVSSVARATIVPVSVSACIQLAKIFDQYGSQSITDYINRYQGRFFAMFYLISLVGNSVSFSILYAGSLNVPKEEGSADEFTTTLLFLSTHVSTPSMQNYSEYEFCGVNDCQDPNIIDDNLDQYVPPNKSSIYILVAVTTFMSLLAMLFHGMIYPGVGRFKKKFQDFGATPSPHKRADSTFSWQQEDEDSFDGCYANEGFENDSADNDESGEHSQTQRKTDAMSVSSDVTVEKSTTSRDTPTDEKGSKDSDDYITTLKKTGLFYLRYEAILLGFTPLRNGMITGFVFSDVTRAYASCVAGVEMTALIAMIFGLIGIPISLSYGRCVSILGRNPIMLLAYLLEMITYVGCYIWEPNPNTVVFVFLIFMGFGIVNAMLKPIISTVYNSHFPKDQHIAVTAWNLSLLLGSGLQYGLSTTMCVKDKIILNTAFATFSVLMYAINEYLHRRRKKADAEEDDISFDTKL